MAVVAKVPHTINGKKYGMFYHFDDGRILYLAWRSGEKTRGLYFQENAWCLDNSTLREAQARGCEMIGIAHRIGKKINYYITNLDDYFGADSEVHPNGTTPQRRLNRDKFIINTTKTAGYISTAIRLR